MMHVQTLLSCRRGYSIQLWPCNSGHAIMMASAVTYNMDNRASIIKVHKADKDMSTHARRWFYYIWRFHHIPWWLKDLEGGSLVSESLVKCRRIYEVSISSISTACVGLLKEGNKNKRLVIHYNSNITNYIADIYTYMVRIRINLKLTSQNFPKSVYWCADVVFFLDAQSESFRILGSTETMHLNAVV